MDYEKRRFANKYDGIDLNNIEKEERERLFINDGILIKNHFNNFDINPELYEEIINSFLFLHKEKNLNDRCFVEIKHIKAKLSTCLDRKHQVKILEKKYKTLFKSLNKIGGFLLFSLSPEECYEYGILDFYEQIESQLSELNDKDLFKYLSHSSLFFFNDIEVFRDFRDILETIHLMEFCMEELKNINEDDTQNSNNNKEEKIASQTLTLNQQLLLLDKIRTFDTYFWDNLHTTKKAELISLLTGKSAENIRKKLPSLDKPKSKLSEQQQKDISIVDNIIKLYLG